MTGYSILWRQARRHWFSLAVGLSALLLVDFLQLYVPRLIKYAVDDLTAGRATAQTLLIQAGWIAAIALLVALLRVLWRPLLMGFSRMVELVLRQRIFDHLQAMHLGYYSENSPGDLMARATNDLNNVRMAAGMGMVAAVDGFVMGVAAMGFMFYISPLLTLLALLPMPLVVHLTRVQTKRMHRGFNDTQASFSVMTEEAREVFSAIGMIKGFALGGRSAGRLAALGREYLDLNIGLAKTIAFLFPLLTFFTAVSLSVVLGVGGPMAVLGDISTGDFVAFTAYLEMLTWPVMAVGWVLSLMKRAQVSLVRISEILDAEPAITDPAEPRDLPAGAPGELEIRDLSFTYPGANRPALAGVSLRAVPGEATALVGPIGSGKSTLLQLLCRLYDPPPGTVLVDGVDVRQLRRLDLRAHLVGVPQRAFLFSSTVRENLSLGRPEAAEEELWEALRGAGLDREIAELENGLDSRLGERGLSLSGGQRQRLTLARALLLDPPVLLLDDPLSAVDTRTEADILANLARMRRGRTTLVVSHRLASVTFARHIYVLDHGRLVEEGDHAALVQAGGLYQSLFSEQALLAQVEG